MIKLRWVEDRDGDMHLEYREEGTEFFHSSSGVIGTFSKAYDTGWQRVPVVCYYELKEKDRDE